MQFLSPHLKKVYSKASQWGSVFCRTVPIEQDPVKLQLSHMKNYSPFLYLHSFWNLQCSAVIFSLCRLHSCFVSLLLYSRTF